MSGIDRPTISHLLQAAHLTWQQILRGISTTTAFVSSFSDVYIKPRCGADFASSVNSSLAEMKNSMLKALDELIEGEEEDEAGPANTNHTLSLKGLCANSKMEIAKQLAYTAVQETKDGSIESYLHLIFSMFTVYQRSQPDVVSCVNTIINDIIKHQGLANDIDYPSRLNNAAFETHKRNSSEVQSYKRYYPELYRLAVRHNHIANKEALQMFDSLMKSYWTSLKFDKLRITVEYYAIAVYEGKVTDDFGEYPILRHCLRYLDVVGGFIDKVIIHGPDNVLDDRTVCNLFKLLMWRNRFYKVTKETLFADSDACYNTVLREDIVPLLYTHSKWLKKYLMIPLLRLGFNSEATIRDFNAASEELMVVTENFNPTVSKLSKKIRKKYGQPKLLVDKEEYEICTAKSKVYNKITLDLTQPISKQLSRLSVDNYAVSDLQLALDVPKKDTLELVQQNITKLVDSQVVDKPGSEVKLLPIISYVVQRILTILQRDFLQLMQELSKSENEMSTKIESVDVLASLVRLGKVTKGFPPALLNLMEVILKLQDNSLSTFNER